jgi:hypothetical protein
MMTMMMMMMMTKLGQQQQRRLGRIEEFGCTYRSCGSGFRGWGLGVGV